MLNHNAARDARARKAILNTSLLKQTPSGATDESTGSVLHLVSRPAGLAYPQPNDPSHSHYMMSLGGYATGLQVLIEPSTGTNTIYELKALPIAIPPVVTPAEMLNIVRDTFMLNVSDAAAVFRVTRPTIYQWAVLTDIDQVRARNDRERMKELYRLSLEWNQLGKLTGRWASQVLRTGQSLFDLLSAETIDRQAILSAHAQLLAASNSRQKAELVRAVDAVKAMSSAFDKLASLEQERKRGRS